MIPKQSSGAVAASAPPPSGAGASQTILVPIPANRFNIPPRIKQVIASCGQRYDVTFTQIMGGSHVPEVTLARGAAARTLWAAGYSISQVGRWLRIHHTSVLYQLRKDVQYVEQREEKLERKPGRWKPTTKAESSVEVREWVEAHESGLWAI